MLCVFNNMLELVNVATTAVHRVKIQF